MKRKIHIAIFIMLLSLFVSTITVYANDMAISETKITVNVGDTYDLDITGTEKIPRWTSWNVNTVKVNQNGEVTALRTGKTTVSARIGLSTKKCSVTVVDSNIKLNKSNATIYTGGTSVKTIQLKATVKGASKSVEWTSSNPEVATVDNNGKVTSVSAGTTTITAKANDKTASCVVAVKDSNISLNIDTMQLSTKGSSIKLMPTIIGSSKSVKWTTSNKNVATVSGGKVTGKNAGTATITATANGVSATCTVNVIKDSISIGSENEILYLGETKQLKTNAGKKDTVVWNSSNETVATVDAKGKVTTVGAGTAIITASLNDTTDTCLITVKDSVMSIVEDRVALKTKGTNKTYTLNFDVVGRSKSVKWTTSNKNIATVSNGKITAKKAGEVTITATANGISDSVEVTVSAYDPAIKLNQSEYTLYTKKGNTYTLKATVDGTSKKVVYSSLNPEIATVNSKGKVTAVAEGQTVITATANGVSAECVINVIESKVNLERYNIVLDRAEKAQIPVDVVGYSQTVKYVSTNTKVATVKNGIITAKQYGEADIKVTANDITSICHVTVGVCEHSYDEGVVTKEPLCDELGIKTFTCIFCGNTYTEDIPFTGHNFSELLSTTEPTCTEQGYSLYICACGEIIEKDFKDALGHEWGEWIITKESTETEVGEKKHICSRCQEEETTEIPVTTHEHSYTSVVVEPTCTEQGYTEYICTCGESYKDTYVDALDHNWGDWEVTKEPTETEVGEKKRTCSRCQGEETTEIPVTTHEHYYASVVVEPTCTEQGYTEYTCVCGESYKDTYVDALNHNWGDWEITKEPTETEVGEKKRTCSRCHEEETIEIPVTTHEHSYTSVVVEPTCTEQGYTEYTCACGESYKDTYVDVLDHNWGDWETIKEATETEVGTKKRVCGRCTEEQTKDIPIETHKHTYDSVVTEPTCTENGYTTYTCGCGDEYVDDYVDALGCEAGEWKVVREPVCDYEGLKHKRCIRCDEWMDGEKIPQLGHSYKEVITQNPTCTETGILEYKCERCGISARSEELPATHTYEDNWTVTKEVSSGISEFESDFGTRQRSCTVCGNVQEQTIINIDMGNGETQLVYGTFWDDEAYKTFDMVNNLRSSLGIHQLKWWDTETAIGYSKVRAVETSVKWSHTRPNGMSPYTGENIAFNHDNANKVFDGWYNSQGHYNNMINTKYTRYHASCFIEEDGTEFWVQILTYFAEDVEELVNVETINEVVSDVEVISDHEIETTEEIENDESTDEMEKDSEEESIEMEESEITEENSEQETEEVDEEMESETQDETITE